MMHSRATDMPFMFLFPSNNHSAYSSYDTYMLMTLIHTFFVHTGALSDKLTLWEFFMKEWDHSAVHCIYFWLSAWQYLI